jgi:hypothetical protein
MYYQQPHTWSKHSQKKRETMPPNVAVASISPVCASSGVIIVKMVEEYWKDAVEESMEISVAGVRPIKTDIWQGIKVSKLYVCVCVCMYIYIYMSRR